MQKTNDVVQQKKMKIMGVLGDFAESIADHATDSLPYCLECVLKKERERNMAAVKTKV